MDWDTKRPPGYVNIYHYPAFGVPMGQRPNPPPVNRRKSARNNGSTGAEAGRHEDGQRTTLQPVNQQKSARNKGSTGAEHGEHENGQRPTLQPANRRNSARNLRSTSTGVEAGGHDEGQQVGRVTRCSHALARARDSNEPVPVLEPRKAGDLYEVANGGKREGEGGRKEESNGTRRKLREKPKKKYRKKVVNEQENEGACGNGEPAPAWDELSPMDAVPAVSTLKAAELLAAAAMERSKRAEVRGRPEWWGPRVKTSTQRMLRLRPAGAPQPGGKSQHADDSYQNNEPGHAVPPGAFLLEGIKVGTMNIPAKAQLLSVGGTPCKYAPFEQVLKLIMSAGKDGDLVFDDA